MRAWTRSGREKNEKRKEDRATFFDARFVADPGSEPTGPGSRSERESCLASPRLATPGGPDPFVPWDPPRHGMPLLLLLPTFSLSLCSLCLFLYLCVSLFLSFLLRRHGGAESFNISRRPPREASSSIPLLLSSSSSCSQASLHYGIPSGSPLLSCLPLEPREHSLDSILMECLRGRYLPHCRTCSLVLSHSSRAPLLCYWLSSASSRGHVGYGSGGDGDQ